MSTDVLFSYLHDYKDHGFSFSKWFLEASPPPSSPTTYPNIISSITFTPSVHEFMIGRSIAIGWRVKDQKLG